MLIEVADLRRQTGNEKEFTGKIARIEIELQGALAVLSEVAVKGLAKNVGGKIYIKGNVVADANLNCSRCLEPFVIPVESSFEDAYFAQRTVDYRDLEETGRIYKGDQIDLEDVIIESLILTLPMKAICHQDCKGLCPSCGCNLNTGHCSCGPQTIDPRLTILEEYNKHIKTRE